jgi:hypothetical protein
MLQGADGKDFTLALLKLSQPGTHDLAGVAVTPRGNELLDESFEISSQRDIHESNDGYQVAHVNERDQWR